MRQIWLQKEYLGNQRPAKELLLSCGEILPDSKHLADFFTKLFVVVHAEPIDVSSLSEYKHKTLQFSQFFVRPPVEHHFKDLERQIRLHENDLGEQSFAEELLLLFGRDKYGHVGARNLRVCRV